MTLIKMSCIAVAVAGLAACGQKAETSADAAKTAPAADELVVKIGHAGPITGPAANYGKDSENGAQVAVDELNAEGVSLGGKKVKFELVSEDDQADPKSATQVAQRLVDAQVAGVIGHVTSGATIPASKIYSDAGIPQISPSATSPSYTQQGYKTAFRVIADDAAQGQALGAFAVNELKAKKIAIIDDRTAYGQGLADEFEKAAKAGGAEIVKREFTNDKSTDFAAILTTLKALKPEVIFFGGMEAQSGPLTKQMKRLGLTAKLLSGDGTRTPDYLKLAGADAEGNYASTAGQPNDKMPGFTSFSEKYKAKFKQDVAVFSPYSYDAVRTLVAAMQKADSAEPAKYLPALSKVEFAGVTGPVKFDAKGDRLNPTVTIYQVKNGQWEVAKVLGGGTAPAGNASAAQ